MKRRLLVTLLLLFLSVPAFAQSGSASASVKVSISVDVSVSAKAKAELADKLYAAGDFAGALKVYAEGYATFKDAAFLYAQAQCHVALGNAAEAKALFEQYLALGAKVALTFKAEAETGLSNVKAKLAAGLGAGVKAGAKIAGALNPIPKFQAAAEVALTLKAEVKAADALYALGKYDEALKAYAAIYLKSPEPILLYAQAQCHIALDHRYEAVALLQGALSAGLPKYKADIEAALTSLGAPTVAVSLAISAAVSASLSVEAKAADALFAAAKYNDALKAYIALYAKSPEPAFLYAQAQCYRLLGNIPEAKVAFEAYLKASASGVLAFKAEAERALLDLGGELPQIAVAVGAGVSTGVGVAANTVGNVGAAVPQADLPKIRPYKLPAAFVGVAGVVGIGALAIPTLRAAFNPNLTLPEIKVDINFKLRVGLGIGGAACGVLGAVLFSVQASASVSASGSIGANVPQLQFAPILSPEMTGLGAGFTF